MIRKLKVLGPALVAVLAMGAVGASGAEAANFTAVEGAAIKAEDTAGSLKLTITGQVITCEQTVFSGTAPASSFTSITFNAEYNGCITLAGIKVTVTGFGQHGETNKCWYVFNASGTLDLECNSGADVTRDAGPCVTHIPAQKGLGTITYTTNGSHLLVEMNISKITDTHTDGFLCPFGSSGHSSEDLLEGELTAVPSTGTLSWDK